MAGDDPAATLAALRAQRGRFYEEVADLRVDVSRGDAGRSTRSVLTALPEMEANVGSGASAEVRETDAP
jgi:hypothetical protein